MKVIFLDIDGVLNSLNQPLNWSERMSPAINPVQVELLNKITEETGAILVLSTSWRNQFTTEGWNDFLKFKGVKAQVTGKTLSNPDKVKEVLYQHLGKIVWEWKIYRGNEIDAWLFEHLGEVESFVILDDGTDMAPFNDKHFVNTDGDLGLTEVDAQRAIEILNAQQAYR